MRKTFLLANFVLFYFALVSKPLMANDIEAKSEPSKIELKSTQVDFDSLESPNSYDDRDPWISFNKQMFEFNSWFDRNVFKPAAEGYISITTPPLRDSIGNFYDNLSEFKNGANALLQLNVKDFSVSLARLVINSTVGMLGFLDVAHELGLSQKENDFGITLGKWHIPQGPYLVLPILGPRTLSSAIGIYPDGKLNPVFDHLGFISGESLGIYGLDGVNKRAALLGYDNVIIGDPYIFIRDYYLQERDYKITGERPIDDF